MMIGEWVSHFGHCLLFKRDTYLDIQYWLLDINGCPYETIKIQAAFDGLLFYFQEK
jgi:hypothetical protein